jgi:hypothetical protein
MEQGRFTKLVGFWIPRRFLSSTEVDVVRFVIDVNEKIKRRGFVLEDGQVLTKTIEIDGLEVVFEPSTIDNPYDTPPRRHWGEEQRAYFGLDAPFQMADEDDHFTWSTASTRVRDPYLSPDERIIGLLHGVQDRYCVYCPCHYADVVYTTRQRLMCMSCGATHLVLSHPLPFEARNVLTAKDWLELFDPDGSRRDEEVDLALVDFRDVEDAEVIWSTDQWDHAKRDFVLFTRSSPDEIAEAVLGTEADPSILRELGWEPVAEPPPPALQLAPGSVDVDLLKNASHAFAAGVDAYLDAYVRPNRVLHALLELFRAVELLLKTKLRDLDQLALNDGPNTPTVLRRLERHGVCLVPADEAVVTQLRLRRNDVQHGEVRMNQRAGLALARSAIVFIDKFAQVQLHAWSGDALGVAQWQQLLEIPELAATADAVVAERIEKVRHGAAVSINGCPRCGADTLVRLDPSSGASCFRCGFVPVVRDADDIATEAVGD